LHRQSRAIPSFFQVFGFVCFGGALARAAVFLGTAFSLKRLKMS